MDLDRNEYPDILVGAYDSNNAVYLKSAPVVHLGNYYLVVTQKVTKIDFRYLSSLSHR